MSVERPPELVRLEIVSLETKIFMGGWFGSGIALAVRVG